MLFFFNFWFGGLVVRPLIFFINVLLVSCDTNKNNGTHTHNFLSYLFNTNIYYDVRPYLGFVLDLVIHQAVMLNLDNHLTCQASNLFDKLNKNN